MPPIAQQRALVRGISRPGEHSPPAEEMEYSFAMKTLSSIALATASVFSSGCAETHWTKPGADAALVSRDFEECREDALRRAIPAGVAASASQSMSPGAGPMAGSPAGGTSGTRFVQEQEDVRECMLRRGYRLQPSS